MELNRNSKTAIVYPLIGLGVAWLLFTAAAYTDLLVNLEQYRTEDYSENELRISTYLYLVAISAVSVMALLGQRIALKVRNEQDSALAKAAHRFTNLGIILSLVAGAVFAIGNFLGAFGGYSRDASAFVRIFGVYVPIVLATALVVTILLLAFVFRKDAPDLKNEQVEDRDKKQRAVGLAYASPILGTAAAIIFGLVVYDVTRTELDVWIWVIIQVIIVGSILLGTRFAAKAKLAEPELPKPRQRGVAAVNLNFVLSILFGVVVTTMAFGFAAAAIDDLFDWDAYWEAQYRVVENMDVKNPEVTGDGSPLMVVMVADLAWWLGKMLPALLLLLLAQVGIYRSLVTRNLEK